MQSLRSTTTDHLADIIYIIRIGERSLVKALYSGSNISTHEERDDCDF